MNKITYSCLVLLALTLPLTQSCLSFFKKPKPAENASGSKEKPDGNSKEQSTSGGSVHGTRWADKTDNGGCQLPQGSYKIQHALALGQSAELGNLAWRNGLCGQVLRVNCGGSAVEAVVASTCNLGSGSCGVDLITKTWNVATGNKPPGVAQCSVELSKTNPLCDGGAGPQAYFTSVGVFNTGGRIVKSAEVAGVNGKFQSGSGYFDFDAQGQPKFVDTASVAFHFEDGSTAKFNLKDCKRSNGVNIWS